MLVTAYRKIRGNKGAMTLAYYLSDNKYSKLDPARKSFVNKTFRAPDGLKRGIFLESSRLLRRGEYPWGASRRIYVPKPGRPDSLRPITIPPFMDRVVQASLTMVLQAIYEPWFEKQKCSFGFRPRIGVHDAIFHLTASHSKGMTTALEGDIKSAYDKVCRNKLINILSERIRDRKLLEMISQRLNYQYWDTEKAKYVQDKEGIPQGGIDSPYLWNIYMAKFDDFVITHTSSLFEKHNRRVKSNPNSGTKAHHPEKRRIERLRRTVQWLISLCNKFINNPYRKYRLNLAFAGQDPTNPVPRDATGRKKLLKQFYWNKVYKEEADIDKEFKYKLIKYKNNLNHSYYRLPTVTPGKELYKFTYARYADDFIILTNAPKDTVQNLKSDFSKFLADNLSATLADEKTLITDIRKDPANFLGFEIRTYSHNKYGWVRKSDGTIYKAAIAGKKVFALPDRQRLINRLFMKGYCHKDGSAKEIGWLSFLEPYIIIKDIIRF